MTRRAHGLALAALTLVAAAAAGALAGARSPEQPTLGPGRAALPAPTQRPTFAPAAAASSDGVVAVARAYARAARDWTADTYRRAWRRQLSLATGRYRRQVHAARRTLAQLDALRVDRAARLAVVTRVRRDRGLAAPRARVLVWLDERTTAAGQTVTGTTRNEVRLMLEAGRWRATGWTALPGPQEGTP